MSSTAPAPPHRYPEASADKRNAYRARFYPAASPGGAPSNRPAFDLALPRRGLTGGTSIVILTVVNEGLPLQLMGAAFDLALQHVN